VSGQRDKQTERDKQTDMLITIHCTLNGGKVINFKFVFKYILPQQTTYTLNSNFTFVRINNTYIVHSSNRQSWRYWTSHRVAYYKSYIVHVLYL